MRIEIFGTGCPKCKMLEANAKKALEDSGKSGEIVKVIDLNEIISRGVMATPAIAIGGKIRAAGRLVGPNEIRTWL